MTVLSVGQIQGLFPSNQIDLDSKVKLKIEGILRLSSIQNSSGLTTLTTTSSGSITLSGSLVTTQNLTGTNLEPSRLVFAIWTSLARPSNPSIGTFGFNETINSIEVYTGTTWEKISGL